MKSLSCRFCGTMQLLGRPGADRMYRCKECYAVLTFEPEPAEGEAASGPDLTADPVPQGFSFGRYTLQSKMGSGAMGVVYDALDTTLNRRVALKILFTTKTDDPKEAVTGWQRFIQEARITANLSKHPNIVTIYEAAVHSGKRYIAMERIQGEPFSSWRLKHSPSRADAIRMIRDVARAVHHAHEHGIVHRDIKPGNVLVDEKDKPIVTDFGLARNVNHGSNGILLAPGMIEGSPAYMSPEQVLGMDTVDARTDIYALGVMLYEVISGRQPFSANTVEELLAKVVQDTVQPPSTLAPEGVKPQPDPKLDAICLKAMAKEPHERYLSAHELADDLSRWLGESASQPAVTRRPRRILAASLAATVIVLGAAALVAWQLQHGRPDVGPQVVRGEELLAAGKAREAFVAFEVALVRDPDHAGARRGRELARKRLDASVEAARREAAEMARHSSELMAREREDRIRTEAAREAEERLKAALDVPPIPVPLEAFKKATIEYFWLDKHLHFGSPGRADAVVPVSVGGDYEVVLSAGCIPALDEFAKFRLSVDGRAVAEVDLTSEAPREYRVPVHLEPGDRTLGVEFTNDFYDAEKKLDRNLHLHRVVLKRLR